jgi:hypothetical protein
MTSKHTTKQHSLLGNRFLIMKYTQLLLGNNLETNNETTFAARQQILNKQVCAVVAGYSFCKQTRSHGNGRSTTINGVFCVV